MYHNKPGIQSSNTQAKNEKSTDLQKPSFLAIEWDSRLLPDALDVVDGDVDPKPSRPKHSLPSAFVVLHMIQVLAKLDE